MGAVVGIPVVFRLVAQETLAALVGIDPYLVVGGLGTLTALALAVTTRGRDDGCSAANGSVREAWRRATRETAQVTVWVTAAFLAYEVLVAATGVDPGMLPLGGLLGVVIGAAIGLVPGCGAQIVVTTLFVQGVVPLPVLVANALSQDGDALFPMLAHDRRAAVLATVVSTVPGVLAGSALHLADVG